MSTWPVRIWVVRSTRSVLKAQFTHNWNFTHSLLKLISMETHFLIHLYELYIYCGLLWPEMAMFTQCFSPKNIHCSLLCRSRVYVKYNRLVYMRWELAWLKILVNTAAGKEATVAILDKNMVLTSSFWDKSYVRVLRTLGQHNISSMGQNYFSVLGELPL